MTFASDIYWLDEEYRRIINGTYAELANIREPQTQARPERSLKRHAESNPKSVTCEDCDESQTAEKETTAHSPQSAKTDTKAYDKQSLSL